MEAWSLSKQLAANQASFGSLQAETDAVMGKRDSRDQWINLQSAVEELAAVQGLLFGPQALQQALRSTDHVMTGYMAWSLQRIEKRVDDARQREEQTAPRVKQVLSELLCEAVNIVEQHVGEANGVAFRAMVESQLQVSAFRWALTGMRVGRIQLPACARARVRVAPHLQLAVTCMLTWHHYAGADPPSMAGKGNGIAACAAVNDQPNMHTRTHACMHAGRCGRNQQRRHWLVAADAAAEVIPHEPRALPAGQRWSARRSMRPSAQRRAAFSRCMRVPRRRRRRTQQQHAGRRR